MRFQEVLGVSSSKSAMGFRKFHGFQLQEVHEISGSFRGFNFKTYHGFQEFSGVSTLRST